jgi:hypothetical protein
MELAELHTYIRNNQDFIPNGERFPPRRKDQLGLRGVDGDQLVSKRFVKKQQMQWTPRGAYLLLQIHTKTLNDNRSRRFGNGTLRSGVLLHHPRLLSGLPFAGSLCSGYSDLERQLFTSRVHLQRVTLLDVRSQEPLAQRILQKKSNAAMNINRVCFAGNLTAEPEVDYSPKGSAVVNPSLANNELYTSEGGERQ